MQQGILNEPVREAADKLTRAFADQMGIPFTNLMFIAVAEDGTFRTANYANSSQESILTVEAVRMIAKHLDEWADGYGTEE